MALAPLQPTDSARRAVLVLAQAVKAKGGRALLVGGCVRDMLLAVKPKDFDVEVYGITPVNLEEIVKSLGEASDIGKAFAVLKLHVDDTDIDISIPRTDSKVAPGHTGFAVHADPSMSYAEAARRRDFTVNAIMLDPLTGEIVDPFRGADDLQAKVLRVVDPALFADDPLRVLRGLQFAARFNLQVDEASKEIMRRAVPQLAELPRERVGAEWRKLLLLAERPSIGLELGHELGVYHQLHPELPPLAVTPQEPAWHPEGNVWIHTLMVVDVAARIIRREKLESHQALVVMLAGLCHDFGKAVTTTVEDGRIRSKGHEEAGRALTEHFLDALAVDLETKQRVVSLVVHHLTPSMFYHLETNVGQHVSDGAIRALARRLHPATIVELAHLSECDFCGMGPFPDPEDPSKKSFRTFDPYGTWLLGRALVIDAASHRPLDLLRGQELLEMGFTPGPGIGELITIANRLRDERGATRDDIIRLLSSSAGNIEIAKQRLQ
ncbi:MAG: CCA tRNA nucleotidyltransferase [Candidatus Uhrbacteria bacterium]|nr:CCA tRNA nucleotidyltransferase [Candidatus Uhrbacteria bacterium]